MKPHIKTLPCFPQVAAVIGESRAQIELFKAHWTFKSPLIRNSKIKSTWIVNSDLSMSFSWASTPQGKIFWCKIHEGINPYHD